MFVKFQRQGLHVVCHELDVVLTTHQWKVSGVHFKGEYYYDRIFMTYEELKAGINDYINYYNNDRYQWNLKSLTPVEYRNQAA